MTRNLPFHTSQVTAQPSFSHAEFSCPKRNANAACLPYRPASGRLGYNRCHQPAERANTPNVLLNVTVNKNAAADDASFSFKTAVSVRALFQ